MLKNSAELQAMLALQESSRGTTSESVNARANHSHYAAVTDTNSTPTAAERQFRLDDFDIDLKCVVLGVALAWNRL